MGDLDLATVPHTWREEVRECIAKLPESMQPHGAETSKPVRYRAFLLYAMMHREQRTVTTLIRAMSRPDSTVRHWKKVGHWDNRIDQYEQGGEQDASPWACRLYRIWQYDRYGRREIAVIERKMAIAFEANEPMPNSDEIGTSELMEARAEVEDHGQRGRTVGNPKEALVRRQMSILDEIIDRSAAAVKAGKLAVKTVNDLATAIRARTELASVLGDVRSVAPGGGAPAPESYRVRRAQSDGTEDDVLAARLEDAEEIAVILRGIRASRQAAAGVIGPQSSAGTDEDESETADEASA